MLKVVCLVLWLVGVTTVQAENLINEFRFGVHYVEPLKSGPEKNPAINFEMLLQPLTNSFFSILFCPRPHFGVSVSARGSTSQFYGGLTWLIPLQGGFFIEPTFGGKTHNAKLDCPSHSRKALGSRLLFRESISFGKEFDNFTLSMILDHASNAGLRRPNSGITTLGVRIGCKI